VHVTDSRHCADKAAHDHTLAVDTHINFSIKNYRKKLKWKISVFVALKAPLCICRWVHLSEPRSVYALSLSL
jgi:hypothetical protein